MSQEFIPVNTPLLNGNEKRYLSECIDTGWISSEGPFVKQFEEKFAQKIGKKYGIAVCNGTAALDVSILALGIGPGDEVILPTFTIISCASAIVRAGAKPVLVDSDPQTWNMNVDKIEEKITHKTKAIMVVHIYGLPVDIDPIVELSKKYGLKIIEDNSEEIGQTYKGKMLGSIGDLNTFSFYSNKHITTGEGGMLVTDDEDLVNRCKSLRNLCFKPERRFVHDEMGFNYRLTNIQAALGLAQLESLDYFVNTKRGTGRKYNDLLKLKDVELPLAKTDYAENIYWVFGLVLGDSIDMDAQEAMKKIETLGIGTRPFFYPMHEQPVFKKMGLFEGEKYPVAERLARKGFYIPGGTGITDEQIKIVADKLNTFFNQ